MRRSNDGRFNKIPPYIKTGLGHTINLKNPGSVNSIDRKTNTLNFLAIVTQSTEFVPRRKRKYLKIINYSLNPIYYAFDGPASINSIYLAPGANDEFLEPPHSSINVIATITDAAIQILELI